MTEASRKSPTEEKEELVALLERSRVRYLSALDALLENRECAVRPGENDWSLLECAEHVARAERGMLKSWQTLSGPGKGDPANDSRIQELGVDRSTKRPAPERARPNGLFLTLAEARENFAANRQVALETLRAMNSEELRNRIVPHALIGTADGYQLFKTMALHEEIAKRLAERQRGAA